MVKKSIYTPAKGVRLSRKKLYKLKQLGGGLLETLFGGADEEEEGGHSPLTPLDGEEEEGDSPEGGVSPLTPLDGEEKEGDSPEGGHSPLTPLDGEEVATEEGGDSPEGEEKEGHSPLDGEEKEGDSPLDDSPEGGKGGDSPLKEDSPLLGTMMGTLDAVSASAKETLDDMTTGNDPSVVNLDSEESSVLLNKDDEIRRLREENTKLLEENRTLSLRLIHQLDTKIDTLEKVDTVEEDVHAVQEDVDTALDTSMEIPENTPLNETPESEVQEEGDKEESSPDSDETPMDISLEEPDDLEDNSVPLTPREKALGGRKRKPKQNETRRKRK